MVLATQDCSMEFSVLGSGSKGNAVFVRSGETGVLIDAGFSGKQIETRMQSIGRGLVDINAILLTHEHHDHITGAGVLSRRMKLPVMANLGTFAGAEARLPRAIRFLSEDFDSLRLDRRFARGPYPRVCLERSVIPAPFR